MNYRYLDELNDTDLITVLDTLPGKHFLEKCTKVIERITDEEDEARLDFIKSKDHMNSALFIKNYKGVLAACERYILGDITLRTVAKALCEVYDS